MRVAVLSDIHGNLPALEAVLAEVELVSVDAIVVAGDTAHGPWAVEVFDLLTENEAWFVRGNADRGVLERDERHGPLSAWTADQLGEKRLAAVSSWPLTLELDVTDLGHVLVCHSTPDADDPIYTRLTPDGELVEIFSGAEADVVVCGHTHMQYDIRLSNGLRIVNPGSVGLPHEGRRGAFWALLGPDVVMRHTEYHVTETVAAIRERQVPVDEELLELMLEPMTSEAAAAEFEKLRGA